MAWRVNHHGPFNIGLGLFGIGIGTAVAGRIGEDRLVFATGCFLAAIAFVVMIAAWLAPARTQWKERVSRIRAELLLFCPTLENRFSRGTRSLEGVATNTEWPPGVSEFRQMLSQWKGQYYNALSIDGRRLYDLAEQIYPRDRSTDEPDFDSARQIIKNELDWFGENSRALGLRRFWKQHLDKYWPWITILAYLEIALAVRARPEPGPVTGGLWRLRDRLHQRASSKGGWCSWLSIASH
jgi:hypothetical protein